MVTTIHRRLLQAVCLALLVFTAACAHHQPLPPAGTTRWYSVAPGADDLLARHAPVFEVPGADQAHNRIGRVIARDADGDASVAVLPDRAVVYADRMDFRTANGRYTNLVYRVHFSGIPFSLVPFNLTAGKNVGLLVVVTLNDRRQPVLVTTVHTCGCYLAMAPTTLLPADRRPPDWSIEPQHVYGERLPGLLRMPENPARPLVTLRPDVHRVMDLAMVPAESPQGTEGHREIMTMVPLDTLERLPLADGSTSFYHDRGLLKGHVKGSVKPLETLLLSLVSLDLFVGADKAFADTDRTGNPFYTSLKPWNRRASDMWHFRRFLSFWGWRL